VVVDELDVVAVLVEDERGGLTALILRPLGRRSGQEVA